jgi:nitroimidazol reductase NimA-like FMN-containing flavoprotein (pyridoxamine 5'-phosphate oxidase superfamily)
MSEVLSMRSPPQVRRGDRVMTEERARQLVAERFCARLGTTGADGWPYVVPMLYVYADGQIYVHNSRPRGHFRDNVDYDPRVCFEIDEADEVFPYGRFECDSAIAYTSVVAFGTVRIVEDAADKTRFFEALMRKYGDPAWDRPKHFFPRLDDVTVYAVTIDRMTGKETALPGVSERWPALDRTKSPRATPPPAP